MTSIVYPPLEQVNLNNESKNIKQADLTYHDMPFQFSLGLPQDTQFRYLSMTPKTGNSFFLFHRASKIQVQFPGEICDQWSWENFYKVFGIPRGFNNEYEFARKIYSERFVFSYLIIILSHYYIREPVRIWESQSEWLEYFCLGNYRR